MGESANPWKSANRGPTRKFGINPRSGWRNRIRPRSRATFSPINLSKRFRHPLRGFAQHSACLHGLADSPVALFRHPLRGLVAERRLSVLEVLANKHNLAY